MGNILQNKPDILAFQPGDPFYLLHIEAKDNGVQLLVLTANPPGGAPYKAAVLLPMPKDYLAAPDLGLIRQSMAEVFRVEGADAPQPVAQQAPPPAPAAEPPRIAVGQTAAEVTAALGQPSTMVKLADKEIYVYKDLKVTFVGGKVADVQ